MNAALDSIFEVALGVELDSLCGSSEEGVNFCKAFDDSSAATLWRFLDPLWKLKKYFNIRSEAKLKENIKVVDAFVYKLINNKVKEVQNKQLDGSSMSKEDIVTRFLHLPEAADPKLLRDIVLSFIIAGKDTTGSTLSWFIYKLCKYPHLQEKIAQEVKSAILNDEKVKINLSKFEDNISEEALEKMQYLHAALTETLRLHPAIPLVSKNCFSDDILPDGFSVNRRDTISYTPYAMGRMKSIWNENAEDFEPERWLDENGNFQAESPFNFTAFQAGPRICLGKEFAYRQMKIISAVLLGCFMFKLKDEKEAVNYRTMISLQIDGGLHVHAFPRV
uniref:Cytochrome P450 n=1 Tax=Kalanchoe fedtschenkoi TaxID=63787 RepID=A0A7N0ZR58_KALFE